MPPDKGIWSFLVDEDMPRSTARALSAAGYQAVDVRDVGLKSHPDDDVYAYAQAHRQTIVTADLGFANILQFPPGTHEGIIVARLPNDFTTAEVNQELLDALVSLTEQHLKGILVIVQPGRVRVRRL